MRILHVQKVKGIGGSERHLLSLLPAVASCGDDVAMLVLTPGPEVRVFLDAAAAANVETFQFPVGRDLDPRPIRGIASTIRRWRPDIVHTHLVHADLWGQIAARRCSVPSVRTVHNVQAFSRREPVRSAVRASGRLARRTIAISEHAAGFIREHSLAPSDRIEVIPYGVDVGCYPAERPRRRAMRSRLGATDETVVFGMAARMIEGKGHDVAIDAVRATAREHPMMLAIAGDGPLRAKLERRASGDPVVRFLGHLDDVVPFLEACDALLFPTDPALGEGFGLAALEAMAEGLPVLASTAGALPEVVGDGVTGRIVDGDVAAWTRAITELAENETATKAMGRAGRERAEGFSIGRMVNDTRRVYREVVA
ncbi:MAG: glycosyltransferase family 4 protein [Actinomycetota bacterium]